MHLIRVSSCIVLATVVASSPAAADVTWKAEAPRARLIVPSLVGPMAEIVPATVDGYSRTRLAGRFRWRPSRPPAT